MANNISMEEQVAQLTQEQQDKIIKVGKIAVALQLIGGIPWLIMVIAQFLRLINSYSYFDREAAMGALTIWLIIGCVYLVGIFAFVKIKYPYYSDARWKYINKQRKAVKQ